MTPHRETPGVRPGAGKPVPPAAGNSAGQPSCHDISGTLCRLVILLLSLIAGLAQLRLVPRLKKPGLRSMRRSPLTP